MTAILTKQETEALIGRSLSTIEDTNFDTYMNLAETRLKDVLCTTTLDGTNAEIQLLIAQMFATIVQELTATAEAGVSSKKVEDFSVTYGGNPDTPIVTFEKTFANLIAKYSECGGTLKSGKVPAYNGDCIQCLQRGANGLSSSRQSQSQWRPD